MSRAGRKPLPAKAAAPAALDADALMADSRAATELTLVDKAVTDSAELFMLVGRIQTAHFYETVSSRLLAETYLLVKEKFTAIGEIVAPDGASGAKRVSSLDEFCERYLGRTQRRCQQLVSSLNLLGGELYEQAERVGFRARDYQALKALPSDAQEAVKAALTSDRPEAAVDLVYDLAARLHASEEARHTLAESVEAKDKLIEQKNKKIDRLITGKKFKPSADSIAQTEEQHKMLEELHEVTARAEVVFLALATVVGAIEAGEGMPKAMRTRAQQAVQFVVQRVADAIDANGIEVSLAEQIGRPEWLAQLPGGADAS